MKQVSRRLFLGSSTALLAAAASLAACGDVTASNGTVVFNTAAIKTQVDALNTAFNAFATSPAIVAIVPAPAMLAIEAAAAGVKTVADDVGNSTPTITLTVAQGFAGSIQTDVSQLQTALAGVTLSASQQNVVSAIEEGMALLLVGVSMAAPMGATPTQKPDPTAVHSTLLNAPALLAR